MSLEKLTKYVNKGYEMKKLILIMVVCFSALHAGNIPVIPKAPVAPIVEDNNLYIGLGTGVRDIREFSYTLGMVLVGYDLTEYAGVEARYIADDKYTNYGVFAKLQYPTEIFTPYVMLGYTKSDYTYSNQFDYSGTAWVIGADIVTPIDNLYIFTDLSYNLDHDNYDRSDHLFLIGLKYRL